jgi:prevent-host-death family protein
MPRTVKVAEAKTHLSALLAEVERGEEVVISNGNRPVARLVPIDERARRVRLIEAIKAERSRHKLAPVTMDELIAWKHEGHKY